MRSRFEDLNLGRRMRNKTLVQVVVWVVVIGMVLTLAAAVLT
ncbi:MAG: hypothetical protein ACRDVM_05545 [Acidimicrobiia bacterium]